jgi:hypothetical protein
MSLGVEEVTDTLQLIVYRGEPPRGSGPEGLEKNTKLREDRCVGQVLIPISNYVWGGREPTQHASTSRKIRSKSFEQLLALPDDEAEGGRGEPPVGGGESNAATTPGPADSAGSVAAHARELRRQHSADESAGGQGSSSSSRRAGGHGEGGECSPHRSGAALAREASGSTSKRGGGSILGRTRRGE